MLIGGNMINDEENNYLEKWSYLHRTERFHKRIISCLLGVIGILVLAVLFTRNTKPLVVEKDHLVYRALFVDKSEIKPTKEALAELITAFIKARYEWESFEPQIIIKKLEPFTTEALRSKLLDEIGKKGFQNKPGESVEQSIARIKPNISDKAILASFDRILRINGIPVVVPTEISLLLAEGPKTFFNPIGLYINGLIEHENQ